ncbi:unnamed protein product [Pleuronectes platessa]|uniref:Ras-related protein Rab-26 n=1 Tax=Pleuronectes platessa TaxID=8262 RepID=A0A9N7U4L9_PLEPL|nr:unnamed protein product [Pleuronectes platessa]
MALCAPIITTPGREERSCLHSEPEALIHPAAAPGPQLAQPNSLLTVSATALRFTHSHAFDAQVIGAMSRKKGVKGKGGAKSPKASPSSSAGRTGKGLTAAAAPSSGLVYPSRPSISNSGEFYDIAFKVRSLLPRGLNMEIQGKIRISCHLSLTVMLVGDSGVGKTCLLVRFKDGAFLAGSFISTVGIDFRRHVTPRELGRAPGRLLLWTSYHGNGVEKRFSSLGGVQVLSSRRVH